MIRVIYYCSYWFSKGWEVIVFRYSFVLYFDWTALPIPTFRDDPIRYAHQYYEQTPDLVC